MHSNTSAATKHVIGLEVNLFFFWEGGQHALARCSKAAPWPYISPAKAIQKDGQTGIP